MLLTFLRMAVVKGMDLVKAANYDMDNRIPAWLVLHIIADILFSACIVLGFMVYFRYEMLYM